MDFYRFTSIFICIFSYTFVISHGSISRKIAKCEICGIQVPSPKIMNGTHVPIGKYPWIVAFSLQKIPKNFCTGTIIASKYILTAAHCLENPTTVHNEECQTTRMPKNCYISADALLIGLQDMKGLQFVEVRHLIPHERYSAKTAINDIALIELKKEIKCNLLPKPLCLPSRNMRKEGQRLIIAGFGFNSPKSLSTEKLMEGKVRQVAMVDCSPRRTITNPKLLCARGADSKQASCKGDSGSTIIRKYKRAFYGIGVTSVGPADCTSERGDLYTDIYKYLKWIKKHDIKSDMSQSSDILGIEETVGVINASKTMKNK
ncbi:transmembrane protease serine 2-like [Argiope bruennichi]|uniref:transmembrane protease serine 2-like n=1 Tax=Argiope bruennichi TaxID=94029 RepID=UPI0024952CF6|nr:transmembrane protease serine 2-like [Argiope bruennichi]